MLGEITMEIIKDFGAVGVLLVAFGWLLKWMVGKLSSSLDGIAEGLRTLITAHRDAELKLLHKQDQIIVKLDEMTRFWRRETVKDEERSS